MYAYGLVFDNGYRGKKEQTNLWVQAYVLCMVLQM